MNYTESLLYGPEFLELGPVPAEEECVGVNPNVDYIRPMREECLRFMNMLESRFASFDKIYFSVKGNDHEFGRYYEVIVRYNPDDEESIDQAFTVESNLPHTWKDTEPFQAVLIH